MMTLQEFRGKYPQYSDIDDETLASGLHKQFYSDIPKDKFLDALKIDVKAPSASVEETIGQGGTDVSDVWKVLKGSFLGAAGAATEFALFPIRAAGEIGAAVIAGEEQGKGQSRRISPEDVPFDEKRRTEISGFWSDLWDKSVLFGKDEIAQGVEEGLSLPFVPITMASDAIGGEIKDFTGDPLLGELAKYGSILGIFGGIRAAGKALPKGTERLVSDVQSAAVSAIERLKERKKVEAPSEAVVSPELGAEVAKVNESIRKHLPDSPEKALEIIGATESGSPIIKDKHFTGKTFTQEKKADGTTESVAEALSRTRSDQMQIPSDMPLYALTPEEFINVAKDVRTPSHPLRAQLKPALKIGDEYATSNKAFTHIQVFEEYVEQGLWPEGMDLASAEPAWTYNGKSFPAKDLKEVHHNIVKTAAEQGRKIPERVVNSYQSIFAEEMRSQMRDLIDDMAGWEGTKNIFDEQTGKFIRRQKATYPPWFKQVFPNDSKAAVAKTLSEWLEKGDKAFTDKQTGRKRIVDSAIKAINESVGRSEHIVEQGYRDRLKEGIQSASSAVNEFVDEVPAAGLSVKDVKIDDFIRTPEGEKIPLSLDPEVSRRIKLATGLGKETFFGKLGRGVARTYTLFKRKFEYLDPKTDGREIDILRKETDTPAFAKTEAVEVLRGIMAGLGPEKYKLFGRAVILPDLLRDAQAGKYERGLPFGYKNVEAIAKDTEYFRNIARLNPDVMAAIDRRTKLWGDLSQELVSKGILKPEVLENPDYFRHQVLDYMALPGQRFTRTSTKDVRLKKKGWQFERKHSFLDYNQDYMEAEFEVLSQSLAQLRTKATIDTIEKASDISGRLKAEAKAEGVKDWRTLLPEDYTLWQPQPGNRFYLTNSISEKVLDGLVALEMEVKKGGGLKGQKPGIVLDMLEEKGIISKKMIDNKYFAKETETGKQYSISEVLAMGGKKKEFAIPKRLAKTLDEFREFGPDSPMAYASRYLMSSWKQWQLMSPFRFIKYNLNNLSGDFDIAFAYNPKIFTYLKKGDFSSLYNYYKHGKAPTPELKAAMEGGILNSGMTINEIPDIGEIGAFRLLSGKNVTIPNRYWDTVQGFTNAREGYLRLAAYRFFKDELSKGKKHYGASNSKEIDAIPGVDARAAKLARELIGDYGNISKAGEWLRNHMIPFYSWVEINAPRYARMFKNVAKQEGAAGVSARMGGVAARKVAAKGIALSARATALFALISLWNKTMFPEEEKSLSAQYKKDLQAIIGKREDGSIQSVRFEGALADALEWFALQAPLEDIREIREGEKTIGDKAAEMAKAPINRLWGALRPEKTWIENIAGITTYPDVFNPRPLRDRKEAIARSVAMGVPYKHLTGMPTRGLAKDVLFLYSYTSDPGETAYHETRSSVFGWLKKQGKELGAYVPTNRANALYYYKKAIQYGDSKAAKKYLEQYFSLGGTREGVEESVKRAHPFSNLNTDDQRRFIASLSPRQKEMARKALKWYRMVYYGEGGKQ